VTHYCGYPERRSEPTLCGLSREPGTVRTTTMGPNADCPDCRDILDGRKP
jgi:hypothetical protein